MSGEEPGTSSATDPIQNVLTISPSNVLTLSPTSAVEATFKELQEEEEAGITVSPTALLSSQAMLVSPTLSNETLQSLLAAPSAIQSGAQFGLPEGIQIITVSSPSSMFTAQPDNMGRIWHIINSDDVTNNEATVSVEDNTDQVVTSSTSAGTELIETGADLVSVLMPPPPPPQNLPPGCPAWAGRMKNCEKIGDYFRGYVESEIEMDILLTYHKQATQSFWGTRQSPSPAKQSTRFMWKSQYVPFDGIPFVNTGSRAVVMECQYGPRRKGGLTKKLGDVETNGEYRQTCPARIYVKKVRKFPEFKIDINLDKRALKTAMDKAFHSLKQQNIDKIGQDRWYLQLPTGAAHEFHDEIASRIGMCLPSVVPGVTSQESQTPGDIALETEQAPAASPPSSSGTNSLKHRLNPLVIQKIREIVAGGEMRTYHVRRLLRMYVCRELYNQTESALSRHDLSLFPTVTDLKNHIHQAVKDIANGSLALTAPTVDVEPLNGLGGGGDASVTMPELGILPDTTSLSLAAPVAETVTVTLTQAPGEGGEHVISRIETHMSDGTTHVSSTLTPETAQLLARLNPNMFPPGSLIQLKATKDGEEAEDQGQGSEVTLNSSSNIEPNSTFAEMNMEVQEADSTLTISPKSDSQDPQVDTLTIAALNGPILTPVNPCLSEQSPMINVSIVPNVTIVPATMGQTVTETDDLCSMQTDSCAVDL